MPERTLQPIDRSPRAGFLDPDFGTASPVKWGRVEDWRGVPKVQPSRLLPVSSGSASVAKP
jgi:hypothetical protein